MRPALALFLSALVLFGVHSYLRFADSLRQRRAVQEEIALAPGKYSADITLTFDAQADSFALDSKSLVFQQQGQVLLERTDLVPAGVPLLIDSLPNVAVGPNAFFFSCVPRESEQNIAKAVRVRIFRDGQSIAEKTLWSEPGQLPRGEILVDVPQAAAAPAKHDHP